MARPKIIRSELLGNTPYVDGDRPQAHTGFFEFSGTDAIDGTDGPWYDAPIGSTYRRLAAGSVADWIKVTDNGATADWVQVYNSNNIDIDVLVTGRYLMSHPHLYEGASENPTVVTLGAHRGWSLAKETADVPPVYESIYLVDTVPYEWDGTSSFYVLFDVALSAAEDAGDAFRLQLSWESVPATYNGTGGEDAVISTSTTEDEVEQLLRTGKVDQYQHYTPYVTVAVADGHPAKGDHFGGRIRNINTQGDVGAMSGEVILLDCYILWPVNAVYYDAS